MVEVQKHGFTFEKWVRHKLFDAYRGKYMQKWDVPPDWNKHPLIPSTHQAVPVSIKTAGFQSPIGLGDALRQRSTDQPFIMIAGFWNQRTKTEKWFEAIGVAKFSAKAWAALWDKLTLDRISDLDRLVKNRSLKKEVAREKAQEWKDRFFYDTGSKIVLNPKIDSSQRRVQCSLPFDVFWEFAGEEPVRLDAPELYGIPFENPVVSRARTFKKK